MTGSREDGWGSVFSDLEPEDAPMAGRRGSTPPASDEEEPTDPSLTPPVWGPADPHPALDELPTETSVAPPPFREEALLDTLEARPAPGNARASPGPAGFWREYREVILTAVIGTAALVAAIAWGRWRPDRSARPEALAPTAAPARDRESETRAGGPGPAPGRAGPQTTAAKTPEPETTAKKKPAALPMLSVVTQPPGAMVRIDGVVYGRTPLIMQAPTDRDRFEVELRLDEHHPWSGIVTKDDAGHFSVNTELEPRNP
jgi:hypothetical protein